MGFFAKKNSSPTRPTSGNVQTANPTQRAANKFVLLRVSFHIFLPLSRHTHSCCLQTRATHKGLFLLEKKYKRNKHYYGSQDEYAR